MERRRFTGVRLGLTAVLTAPLALAACSAGQPSGSSSAPATLSPAGSSPDCGTHDGRGCAPPDRRIDLDQPTFTNPTAITNPLFPIAELRSALLLGEVDDKTFRTETTLLPGTETVMWNGEPIEALVSQYAAYLDGRLTEVAIDRYAQADDGSVWYLGEDVFDYENGAVAVTEGTWLTGREGPAAMIMPADPQIGDVYRPENVPGIVFEEVTIASVGQTVDGPLGPVDGAIVASELHLDGTTEDKTFAPGYGEFLTGGGGDVEALALAVPADAVDGPAPTELGSMATAAQGLLESVRLDNWDGASSAVTQLTADWAALQDAGPQPRLVAERLDGTLAGLTTAVGDQDAARAAQRAVDVGQSVLDLALSYTDPTVIDLQRFELWTQQLRIHAAADDAAGVLGDVAVLEWIRDRFVDALPAADRDDVDGRLRDLRSGVESGNLPSAADQAARLYAQVRMMAPAS